MSITTIYVPLLTSNGRMAKSAHNVFFNQLLQHFGPVVRTTAEVMTDAELVEVYAYTFWTPNPLTAATARGYARDLARQMGYTSILISQGDKLETLRLAALHPIPTARLDVV